jgi:dTDP-4-dehydrorhamnose reductase
VALDRHQCDLGNESMVRAALDSIRPEVVLNAAAYTAVDRAESDPASAARVNAQGVRLLAEAAARVHGCRVVHVSTDYVFSGNASRPYAPGDAPEPINAYGRSKLEGERLLLATLGGAATVVRTAWVYGSTGSNFLLTMLRLMRERETLAVVADQIGAPTSVGSLSEVLWAIAARPACSGIYHWSDAGVASWYDFAIAIAEEAFARGMLPRRVSVTPIFTEQYPTPAARPRYSVLDSRLTLQTLGKLPMHWRVGLRSVLDEMQHV